MIFAANRKYKIGEITKQIVEINSDSFHAKENKPIMILRECSFEEYVEDLKISGDFSNLPKTPNEDYPYFYEISLD